MFQLINPYNQEVLQSFYPLTAAQIAACLDKTTQASLLWKYTNWAERLEKIANISTLLRENAEQLATQITTEMGKPIVEAKAEINKCAVLCDYYVSHASAFFKPEVVEAGFKKSYVKFEPLGCVLGIMPWNFPFWQVFRFAIPALVGGNTVLLKHAPNTVGCGETISKLFEQAGFPLGVFQHLIIENEQVESLIAHAIVQAVTLTGSEKAGKQVAQIAGKYLKKTVMELGGSDAFIVLADAPLEKAVEVAVASRMVNSGQSCIAAKRFIVAEPVYEQFIDLLCKKMTTLKIGNPLDESTTTGVIARADLLHTLHRQVTESVTKGAKLLMGGKIEGNFYLPTLLADVKRGMPAFDEELFGGVFAVCSFKTESQALAFANDSSYGLAASIWTSQTEKAEELASKLECGAVFINTLAKSDPCLPFGGIKKSGYGRELSHYGIKEFVNIKTIVVG
jgi:succinate-semialdehyde dehydrogenase / glutarate-semialdehyde dehydrogenase